MKKLLLLWMDYEKDSDKNQYLCCVVIIYYFFIDTPPVQFNIFD